MSAFEGTTFLSTGFGMYSGNVTFEISVTVNSLTSAWRMIIDGRIKGGNSWDTETNRGVFAINSTNDATPLTNGGSVAVSIDGVSGSRLTLGKHVIKFTATGLRESHLLHRLFCGTSTLHSSESLKGITVHWIKGTFSTAGLKKYDFHYVLDGNFIGIPTAGVYKIKNLVSTAIDEDVTSIGTNGSWTQSPVGTWTKTGAADATISLTDQTRLYSGCVLVKFKCRNVGNFALYYMGWDNVSRSVSITEGDNEFYLECGKTNSSATVVKLQGSSGGATFSDIKILFPRTHALLHVANKNNFVAQS